MMKELFRTSLPIEGAQISYNVHFENEGYLFEPEQPSGKTLRFYRAHDEWKWDAALPEHTTQAAVAALDDYLLSQH